MYCTRYVKHVEISLVSQYDCHDNIDIWNEFENLYRSHKIFSANIHLIYI